MCLQTVTAYAVADENAHEGFKKCIAASNCLVTLALSVTTLVVAILVFQGKLPTNAISILSMSLGCMGLVGMFVALYMNCQSAN